MTKYNPERRFGIELEVNAFDGKSRPEGNNYPVGIEKISAIVLRATEDQVETHKNYHHTDNNLAWVVKPDNSCGIEICTPILKGWSGLKKTCLVSKELKNCKDVKADNRCSMHIHVDTSAFTIDQIASILTHWIRFEQVFLDSVPDHRKNNKYCPMTSLKQVFQSDINISSSDVTKRMGSTKYNTANCHQYIKNGRMSVEFRIIEGDGVLNPMLIKNWSKLMIHLVEVSTKLPYLVPYKKGNELSGICIVDPIEMFNTLGFNPKAKNYELSEGLKQTRNWFLARILKYQKKTWIRKIASEQIKVLCQSIKEIENVEIDERLLDPNQEELIFDEKYSD